MKNLHEQWIALSLPIENRVGVNNILMKELQKMFYLGAIASANMKEQDIITQSQHGLNNAFFGEVKGMELIKK
jgi:hypothetical protein